MSDTDSDSDFSEDSQMTECNPDYCAQYNSDETTCDAEDVIVHDNDEFFHVPADDDNDDNEHNDYQQQHNFDDEDQFDIFSCTFVICYVVLLLIALHHM